MPSPYPHGADVEQWTGAAQTDPNTVWAVHAAASAIEQACGRQFTVAGASEDRVFQAEHFRGTTYVDIDDCFSVDSVTVDGNPVDYVLRNPKGKPFTRLEIPACVHGWVTVSAPWGWPEIPAAIRVACSITAARLLDRRENVAGALVSARVDDVESRWSSAALDHDVELLVAPYRRHWAAA